MDYAGNSNKAREEAAEREENTEKPEVPEKNLEKVVTGNVTIKKKTMGRRFRELFFGADFKEVMNFVYEERVIPSVKTALYEAIVGGSERALWGLTRRPTTHQHPGMRPRAQYQTSTPRQESIRPDTVRLPHQPPHPSRVNKREANDIVFASKADAQQALDVLVECVYKYEMTSLADLYELAGLPVSPIDQRWGWTNLSTASIRQIRDGYLLELPQMEEISS